MMRRILGVVLGYATMAVFIFLTFSLLYLILGADGSFEPKSYDVSLIWIIISFIFGIIAAVLGGYVCVLISKSQTPSMVLSALVLVIGLTLGISQLGPQINEVQEVRTESVPNWDAMQKAKQPAFILLMNPIIGALSVLGGSRLKKEYDD